MGEPIVERSGDNKFKATRIEARDRITYSDVIELDAETTVVGFDRDVHVTEITVDMAEKKLLVAYK